MVAMIICLLTVSGGWPAASGAARPHVLTLREWASAQPRQYTPDGLEIPFSATPYFRQYHPDSVGPADWGRAGARWDPVLRATGTHCRVFVDSAAYPQPNDTYLENFTAEFDDHIWTVDTAVFGSCGYSSVDVVIYSMDGQGGVGGYYAGGNTLYIDSSDLSWGYEILTHEFQHCIHNNKDAWEQAWVNEGCADLAIQLCYGYDINTTSLGSHIEAFQARPDNDLTVFDNELYDYGSSYAFVSYFHQNFGGNATITALVADKAHGISGFNDRLAGTGRDFTSVFRDWTVANYMNNRSIAPGYGYSNMSIKVGSTQVKNFPVALNGSVGRWAAVYYNFTTDCGDLILDFNGSDGAPLEVALGLVGRGAVPSAVRRLTLDAAGDGYTTVPRLGVDYSEIVMVVSASTSGGNFSFTAKAIDRTPPVTELTLSPPRPDFTDGWYAAPPNISLKADEPHSVTFYRWDNGSRRAYSGPLPAMEGRHSFTFWSKDLVGNEEAERTVVIKVDTTPPMTAVVAVPPEPDGRAGWYRQSPWVDLTAEIGAKTYYSWDGGPESGFDHPMLPAEGVHTLIYHSVDSHGNVEMNRSALFRVDTVRPLSGLFVYPPAPDGLKGWYLGPPVIRLEPEEGGEVYYYWNSEPLRAYVLPLTAREGQNILTYYAMDQAGNTEVPNVLVMNVDTIPPDAEARLSPPAPDGLNDYYRSDVSIVLASEPDANITFRWDHGRWSDYHGTLWAPEGYHELSYYATDEAGNRGEERSLELRVDLSPPATTLSVEPELGDVWYTEPPTVTMLAEPGSFPLISLDGAPAREYNGRVPLSSGIHQLSYWSVDEAGNEEVGRTRELRLDLNDPVAVLELVAPYAIEGQPTSFAGGASCDADSGIQAYRFVYGDGEESGWISSPAALHAYSKAGSYRASLTVRDASGRVSAPAETAVTVNFLQKVDGPEPSPAVQRQVEIPWMPLLLASEVLLLVAGIAYLVRRRKRLGKGGAGPPRGQNASVVPKNAAGPPEDNLKMPKGPSNARKSGP